MVRVRRIALGGLRTAVGYSHELREVTPRVFVERLLRRFGFKSSQVAELLAAAVPGRRPL
jgi:hypothetical protein